jgi:hypothetical protein
MKNLNRRPLVHESDLYWIVDLDISISKHWRGFNQLLLLPVPEGACAGSGGYSPEGFLWRDIQNLIWTAEFNLNGC